MRITLLLMRQITHCHDLQYLIRVYKMSVQRTVCPGGGSPSSLSLRERVGVRGPTGAGKSPSPCAKTLAQWRGNTQTSIHTNGNVALFLLAVAEYVARIMPVEPYGEWDSIGVGSIDEKVNVIVLGTQQMGSGLITLLLHKHGFGRVGVTDGEPTALGQTLARRLDAILSLEYRSP